MKSRHESENLGNLSLITLLSCWQLFWAGMLNLHCVWRFAVKSMNQIPPCAISVFVTRKHGNTLYSHLHRLLTFITVTKSSWPSTLHGMVQWTSDFALSKTTCICQWWVWMIAATALVSWLAVHVSSRIALFCIHQMNFFTNFFMTALHCPD